MRSVSRSEAKRLLRGVERFTHVTMDFTGIEEGGQGFVDEIFRVWPKQHPDAVVEPIGMVGPVEFMVRRGLGRRSRPLSRLGAQTELDLAEVVTPGH